MPSESETADRSVPWFFVITLLPVALLIGSLSGGQIIRQCGLNEVFACMDRNVNTMLYAYDLSGLVEIIRTAMESNINGR